MRPTTPPPPDLCGDAFIEAWAAAPVRARRLVDRTLEMFAHGVVTLRQLQLAITERAPSHVTPIEAMIASELIDGRARQLDVAADGRPLAQALVEFATGAARLAEARQTHARDTLAPWARRSAQRCVLSAAARTTPDTFARTAPRRRGAGRPARRSAASSPTAGTDPGDPDEPEDQPAPADSPTLAPLTTLSLRQARFDIAAGLAPRFDTTAGLARYLIERLGWNWASAYAATGDLQLYGGIIADGRGRIRKAAMR